IESRPEGVRSSFQTEGDGYISVVLRLEVKAFVGNRNTTPEGRSVFAMQPQRFPVSRVCRLCRLLSKSQSMSFYDMVKSILLCKKQDDRRQLRLNI
ncbi:Uncharacterized protein FWK35_00037658, partial [Aphis craccivora]